HSYLFHGVIWVHNYWMFNELKQGDIAFAVGICPRFICLSFCQVAKLFLTLNPLPDMVHFFMSVNERPDFPCTNPIPFNLQFRTDNMDIQSHLFCERF